MKEVTVLTSEFKRFCSQNLSLISDLKMQKVKSREELEFHAVNREKNTKAAYQTSYKKEKKKKERNC